MANAAYEISRPAGPVSCVVFASPHSGRDYTPAFLRRTVLNRRVIRSSEDAFVDQLFECAPDFGAPLLKALAPRAFVDMNRARGELDPALIMGVNRQGHNPRVTSGLGVIPRVVANGRAIYNGKLSIEEAEARIEGYWVPYHTVLQGLLDTAHMRHGQAVLIDCHSMPHEAIDGAVRSGLKRPDVVLGDRFGASASGEVMDRIEEAFVNQGFNVARNTPFAGAYVTQTYGRPSRGQHAVQVELDRALYMDERTIKPNRQFEQVRSALRAVVTELVQIGQGRVPLAAE